MIFSRSTLKLQVLEKAVFWNPWIQLVNSLMYSEGRWKMLNICPDIFDSLWYMNIKSRGWHRGVIRIFDVNSLIKSKLKALEMKKWECTDFLYNIFWLIIFHKKTWQVYPQGGPIVMGIMYVYGKTAFMISMGLFNSWQLSPAFDVITSKFSPNFKQT